MAAINRMSMAQQLNEQVDGQSILDGILEEVATASSAFTGVGADVAKASLAQSKEDTAKSRAEGLVARKGSSDIVKAAFTDPNASDVRDLFAVMRADEKNNETEIGLQRSNKIEAMTKVDSLPSTDSLTARMAIDKSRLNTLNRSEEDRNFLAGKGLDASDNAYMDVPNNAYMDVPNNAYMDVSNNEYMDVPNNAYMDVTNEGEAKGLMTRPKARPDTIQPETKDFEIPEYKVFDKADDMSELEILARTIEAEASGEKYAGKIAVGAVIANRVSSGSYGSSGGIKGVILKEAQFSPWNSITGGAKGEQGKDMLALKASDDSYRAANAILTGNYTDETGGASHYVNESISTPEWLNDMKSQKKGTITIGKHLFGNADNNKVYDGKTGSIQRIIGTKTDGQFGPDSRKKAISFLNNKGIEVPKDISDADLMQLVVTGKLQEAA